MDIVNILNFAILLLMVACPVLLIAYFAVLRPRRIKRGIPPFRFTVGRFGALMVACGLLAALGGLLLPTSVDTPIGPVTNLSLEHQQSVWLTVSGIVAIVGAILWTQFRRV